MFNIVLEFHYDYVYQHLKFKSSNSMLQSWENSTGFCHLTKI